MKRFWGRSISSAFEDPWSFVEAIHPEDRQRVLSMLTAPWAQERRPLEHEHRILRPKGNISY
ncbi:MAG: PAS domain-containing protein [Deltaproteobacteria bacterium]|nr:PAS domain-containing protein [Deltaproteobacteria bacterium]